MPSDWRPPTNNLGRFVRAGDRVIYSRDFLKATGIPATDPVWFLEGVVREVFGDGEMARVAWGGMADKGVAVTVRKANLVKRSDVHLESR